MQYEILEHPADLKIRAYGKDLPELFSHTIKGMFESCRPTISDKTIIEREIKISAEGGSASGGKADSLENLLVDFLSEALYLSDINDEVYLDADFQILTDKELKGKIRGQKVTGLDIEIKAVTWHDLEIKKEGEQWQATVLFDI